jgi:recombination protein RecA
MYGKGISAVGELLDLAVEHNLIGKSGAWFSFGDERIGQGRDNAKTYLQENTSVTAVIEAQVRQALGMPQVGSEALAASAQTASMEIDTDLFDDQDLEPDLRTQEGD